MGKFTGPPPHLQSILRESDSVNCKDTKPNQITRIHWRKRQETEEAEKKKQREKIEEETENGREKA